MQTNVGSDLGSALCELYALDDFARRYEETPFSSLTMQEATSALITVILGRLQCSAASLPPEHSALREIDRVKQALSALSEFMVATQDEQDPLIPKRAMSTAMRALVERAGAALDRAVMECGEHCLVSGYFDGSGEDPNRRAIATH